MKAVSTVTPRYPQTVLELPDFATDSSAVVPPPDRTFKDSIAGAAYEEAGIGPDDLSLAEVYDLSTALELDWYENIGLCGEGEAEALLRSGATEIGGRIPVNPSGGLACFGEAIPAQAIAQVCEVTWQLRGQAGARQVGGRDGGNHRQPGIVRSWVVRDRQQLSRTSRRGDTAMAEAYIVEAVRTPVGRRGGGLSQVHPADLGAHSIKALIERTGVDPAAVDDVVFGNVDSIGPQAGDIARTCWLVAGFPEHVPGTTVDRQCGSRAAGHPLRRAGRDVGHAGPRRRRRRAEHEPDPDHVGDGRGPAVRARDAVLELARAGRRATATRRSRSSAAPR